MSNLTLLVFFVTMFVISQHGLAVRNFTTTGSIETQADGREEILNSPQQEKIRFPRSTHSVHRVRGVQSVHRVRGVRRPKQVKSTKFIINGLPARKGQFPYQVAVHQKSDLAFLVSGAIITKNYVLTTADVLCNAFGERSLEPQDLVVHAGMVRLHAEDLQSYDVHDTVCHEQYNPTDNRMNDLALIKTTNRFIFSANVKRIKLSKCSYGGSLAVMISGWGSTTQGMELSEHLQYGNTFTLSLEECNRRLETYPTDRFLSPITGCLYSHNETDGAYTGILDHGAPVVHRGHLIGLVARYYIGAHTDGYVSVPHNLDWIKRNV